MFFRNHVIPPLYQLLIALRFYASGSLYITMGDFGGIHKTTAGKIIKRVTSAIVQLRHIYLRLPRQDEMNLIQQQFYEIARFPRVIGAVDCTHIRICNPGGNNAENFRNRKGYFSLNTQAVCNANYEIIDIVARWPGGSHDSNIFDNSRIRMRFEAGEMGRYLLLGDSGYPVRPYLITPLNNPQTPAERLFNHSQIRTRTVVERTFGIWKRRFPILMGMRCRLPLCQDIIVATAVLHNICRRRNEDNPEDIEIPEEDNDAVQNNYNENDGVRRELIDYFFTLL